MKRISCIVLLSCLFLQLSAQVNDLKKPSTLVFHGFYNDFNTANRLRASSLSNVLKNKLWAKLSDMQMGFGFNYLKGLTSNIDLIATVDASSTDYLYKNGTTNGSSKLLLDANAGLNLKLLTDRHAVSPYLFGGAGLSVYNGKTGFYIPVGAGVQVNVFSEAFIFINTQYRFAGSSTVNDHFYYSLGIGTTIGKKKKIVPPVVIAPAVETVVVPAEVKIQVKDLLVIVTDEATALSLAGVEVTLNGTNAKLTGISDDDGLVTFTAVQAADYRVSGELHLVNTTSQQVLKSSFDITDNAIKVNISHNDPRFTLAGHVNNKGTHQLEGGVTVTAVNTAQSGNATAISRPGDGAFDLQLEANGDFTVSGKKANYISNIEKVTTKGLNRSTTIYVKLELGIEEAHPDKTIALTNIYYDNGSTKIRASASSDLEKLVQFLKDNPALRIEIASHTDSRSSNAVNMTLSTARAQQVVNYLQKNGIDKGRLIAKGYGETKPVNGCTNGVKCTEAQHEKNRRTEFKVLVN